MAQEPPEQQDKVVQPSSPAGASPEDAPVTDVKAVDTLSPPRKKRVKRRGVPVNEADIMPRPSYWPLVLAGSLVVLLLGVLTHPVILVIGGLLILTSILGWTLERR